MTWMMFSSLNSVVSFVSLVFALCTGLFLSLAGIRFGRAPGLDSEFKLRFLDVTHFFLFFLRDLGRQCDVWILTPFLSLIN